MAVLLEEGLTYRIRGCVFEVFSELGAGFLERVYENALAQELTGQCLEVCRQSPIEVRYKGQVAGEYVADLVVEDRVIVELKTVTKLLPEHEAQLLNYLKATGIRVGLLVNFAHPRAQIKRFVL